MELKGLLFVRCELPSQTPCSCEADSKARTYDDLYYLVDKYVSFGEGTGTRKIDESERVWLSDERDHTTSRAWALIAFAFWELGLWAWSFDSSLHRRRDQISDHYLKIKKASYMFEQTLFAYSGIICIEINWCVIVAHRSSILAELKVWL